MSIRIHYPENSDLSQIPYYVLNKEQALAFDAIDLMLHSLCDITKRLEERLTFLSLHNDNVSVMAYRLAIFDAWMMVDVAYSIVELMSVADVTVKPEDENLVQQIKLMRHSYQHADARIREYFVKNGSSVYGNLSWYYPRNNAISQKDGTIYKSLLFTGIQFADVKFTNSTNEDLYAVKDISFVDLHYIKNIATQNKPVIQNDILQLDSVADFINTTIIRMEKASQPHMNKIRELIKSNSEFKNKGLGGAPFTIVIPFPVK